MNIEELSKEELLEYLEEISQQLNNIALDQIPFAIAEEQFNIELKDKVIDMMAEYIDKAYFDRERIEKWFEKNILPKDDFDLVDYKERYIRYPIIKEYFYNKIEIPEEN